MNDLPTGWVDACLGDIADVIAGQSPPGRSYNTSGVGVPFFQGKAEFGAYRPTVRKWTTDPKKWASEGDVLLSVRAPVGPTNLSPTKCAIGRGLTAIHPLGGVDPRYVLWAVRGTEGSLVERSTGTTFAAVSGAMVRAHRVPLAPPAEQRRIVAAIEEHFSRLDAADASMFAAGLRLASLRGQVVEQLLGHEWPMTYLGEIADIVGGVTKDAKRQADPSYVEVPYLRVANVQRGYLDLSEVTSIRVDRDKATALALRPGDVLFNEGGDRDKLGRGWVWSGEIDPCIHQNHVFRARLHPGFEPRFVSWHGNTFGRRWFEEHGRQTTNLASINLGTLKRFPVPAPPLSVQRRVVEDIERRLSLIDALQASVARCRAKGNTLRRAILERAFTGRLVPQDTSDEPASILLKRIAADRARAQPARRRRPRAASAG